MSIQPKMLHILLFCLFIGLQSYAQESQSVQLKTTSGQFIKINDDGSLTSTTEQGTSATQLEIVFIYADKNMVALKTSLNKYLTAEGEGRARAHFQLSANAEAVGEWQTFELIDLGNKQFAFKTHYGTYVQVDNAGKVSAKGFDTQQNARFELVGF
ncbi:fascin domain-containing protein [Eisenibacter elegans]|uniref:fascin domain-containing protein n=1 Tax=Eisenibacter elegans TaxID=997 RepID=UPI0004790F28|nr:hypothetical protein [Eisenibacter elegans]